MVYQNKLDGRSKALKLLDAMSLGELLEASTIIQKGIKEDKIPVEKSEKAKEYSEAILALKSGMYGKCAASELEERLNA